MLYIHTSNQLEQLKNQYATVVNTPLTEVFKAETVVVQNAGMARWLAMEMAQAAGISANTKYLFPAEFMWGLLRLVSPDIPEHSQCAPDTLRFHIYEELNKNYSDYPELHHYILSQDLATSDIQKSSQIDQLSVWELSCQCATLLDRYLFYRGEWITIWESNSPNKDQSVHADHWQARLWNRCVTEKDLLHWLALQQQFTQNIEDLDTSLLPERICFFSMSALSPGYIELLGNIAQKTDIHIFIINPCEDVYWGDIRSPKEYAKLQSEEQIYTDIGNPLLASLGKQGRDFIEKLLELQEHSQDQVQTFTSSAKNNEQTLLTQVQEDIYQLQQPLFNDHFSNQDGSIEFHSCHTAMREVEVLHDQILAQLDADKDLAPSDIVVMMPDIEKYSPYIESVFATAITKNNDEKWSINKEQKLPFSIADRDPQNIFKIIQALNKLFALPNTHFDVEAVFEILEYDDIRIHFDLDQEQLNYCRELALATNIRWGISAKTRQQHNLPNTEEHTWKYALDSMLLGYSIADSKSAERLFKSDRNLPLLGYAEIEGSNALVLAKLKRFTDIIFVINDWQNQSYSLNEWLQKTTHLIQQLTAENPDQQRIFKSLSDIQLQSEIAGFKEEITFVVFQKMLQQSLRDINANEKYLGYGITFCALVPMRSVPFKIIALMGMNDGEFPRQEIRPSFDLMANQSLRGDRSRRDEDRYLFLESILAARSKLIISYVGQSIKDNSELPPSILVSELLDSLTTYSKIHAEDWIIKHPLHAFSSKYFTAELQAEEPLFSYASHYLLLKSSTNNGIKQADFINKPLQALDNEFKRLTLDELINFFKNPARIFLKTRFAIQTYDNDAEQQTREPFAIESFKDSDIRKLILADDIDCNDKQLIARAKGLLPYGQIGDEIYAKEKHTVEVFEAQLPELIHYADQHIVLTIGDFRINAKLDQLTNLGRYIKQLSKPYAGDYISIWLSHLCMNAYNLNNNIQDSQLSLSQFHSPEKNFELAPVSDAEQQLSILLDYYWQGLHFPLPFFAKSGFALFGDNGTESLSKMAIKWNGNDMLAGEKASFENWLLHRNLLIDHDSQPEEFLQISRDLFGKMYEVLN